jgi:predicted chitinase
MGKDLANDDLNAILEAAKKASASAKKLAKAAKKAAKIAAKIAVHFWQNRVVPRVDNFADTAAVTRPINRRLTGLDDRDEKFKGLHHVLVANK